jgi:hypothetical protein
MGVDFTSGGRRRKQEPKNGEEEGESMQSKQIRSTAPPCTAGIKEDEEEDRRLPDSQQRWRSAVASYQI